MLACCILNGWSRGDYVEYAHPLQAAIRAAVARTAGVAEHALVAGIDGCSAPNYALPLSRLAQAYARLATADAAAPVLARLAAAMTAHPDMVSGQHRSDLALMQAGRGDWVTKIGAEGVQAAAQAAAAKLREFLEGRARFVEVMAALVAPFNASPLDEAADGGDGSDGPPSPI